MTDAAAAGQSELHDAEVLQHTHDLLAACNSPEAMKDQLLAAVGRNEDWRGRQCINLLAPEAPTSPTVRQLLASEVGTRAAEGHIGKVNRWFAGTQHIDEIEAICIELLKRVFRCRYAEHRLMGSMLGNMAVYNALTEPGDVVMSVAQPVGGHSSNRGDGPAGVRGLQIVDVPFDADELTVDIDLFRRTAPLIRPKLVALGLTMTLFPLPLQEMKDVLAEWGGRLFFDGAHQLGLIAAGLFQDPLVEGADIMTGSAGKTFSGPQSGIMLWNDSGLNDALMETVFPVLVATHQVNRVAALAASAAEMLEFGPVYMGQIAKNAQALAAALHERGVPVLCAHKGFTETHQVIGDVGGFGGGLEVAHRLAEANVITNKNLLPHDRPDDWDRPSGLRIGTIEVMRLGMYEAEMREIAGFIARVLIEGEDPKAVAADVIALREPFQTGYYCFDNGLPPE